jgi:hypothetical protein
LAKQATRLQVSCLSLRLDHDPLESQHKKQAEKVEEREAQKTSASEQDRLRRRAAAAEGRVAVAERVAATAREDQQALLEKLRQKEAELQVYCKFDRLYSFISIVVGQPSCGKEHPRADVRIVLGM